MRAGKRRGRPARPRSKGLPIQAIYRVAQLARAMGVPHRQLQRLLEVEDVQVFRVGRLLLVPLAELEEKVPALQSSCTSSHTLWA